MTLEERIAAAAVILRDAIESLDAAERDASLELLSTTRRAPGTHDG